MVVLPRFLFEASLGLSWLDMVDERKTCEVELFFVCLFEFSATRGRGRGEKGQ